MTLATLPVFFFSKEPKKKEKKTNKKKRKEIVAIVYVFCPSMVPFFFLTSVDFFQRPALTRVLSLSLSLSLSISLFLCRTELIGDAQKRATCRRLSELGPSTRRIPNEGVVVDVGRRRQQQQQQFRSMAIAKNGVFETADSLFVGLPFLLEAPVKFQG